jgi:hypothetical protein
VHIEPGVVSGAKLILSYATGSGALGLSATMAAKQMRADGLSKVLARSTIATGLVLVFFQLLPHARVGVSEVHLILGSTLFLLFGAGPAACGLAVGLLLQGAVFEPSDLPQFGMNVTTLVGPIVLVRELAKRLVQADTPYIALTYPQTLKLSLAYQGGVVGWVTFWVLYGQGPSVATFTALAAFGASYAPVVCLEPLIDLGALAAAKSLGRQRAGILNRRLWSFAT